MNVRDYYKNKKTEWAALLGTFILLSIIAYGKTGLFESKEILEWFEIAAVFVAVKLSTVLIKKLYYLNDDMPLWLIYTLVPVCARFITIYILNVKGHDVLVLSYAILFALNLDYLFDKWKIKRKDKKEMKKMEKAKGVKKENQEIFKTIQMIKELNLSSFKFDLSELDVTTDFLGRDDVRQNDLEKLHYEVILRIKEAYSSYDKHVRKDDYATKIAKETIVNLMTKVKETNDYIIGYTDNYTLEILNEMSK